MRIADETPGQRRRLDEIKRQRKLASDHALLMAALVALTGGPSAQTLPLPAEDLNLEPCPQADEIRLLWNQKTTLPIPRSTRMTPALRKKILTRLKAFKLGLIEMAFAEIERTPWCRGEGVRDWLVTLAWVMKSDDNVQKFVDAALSRRTPTTRVPTCRHTPPCTDQSACTDRLLKEMR